jgi:hypothetical protein
MMDIKEQKVLNDTINSLVGKANGYDRIKNFFDTNQDIKKVYNEVKVECVRNGCYSEATTFIVTIEKLLERIDIEN